MLLQVRVQLPVQRAGVGAGRQQHVVLAQQRRAQVLLQQVAAPDGGAHVAHDAKARPQLLAQPEVVVRVRPHVADHAVDTVECGTRLRGVGQQLVQVVEAHVQAAGVRAGGLPQQQRDVLVGEVDPVLLRQRRVGAVVVQGDTHGHRADSGRPAHAAGGGSPIRSSIVTGRSIRDPSRQRLPAGMPAPRTKQTFSMRSPCATWPPERK